MLFRSTSNARNRRRADRLCGDALCQAFDVAEQDLRLRVSVLVVHTEREPVIEQDAEPSRWLGVVVHLGTLHTISTVMVGMWVSVDPNSASRGGPGVPTWCCWVPA